MPAAKTHRKKYTWIGFFQSCVDNATKILLAALTVGGGYYAAVSNSKINTIQESQDSSKVAAIHVVMKADSTSMKVDSANIKSAMRARKTEIRDSLSAVRDSVMNKKIDAVNRKLDSLLAK